MIRLLEKCHEERIRLGITAESQAAASAEVAKAARLDAAADEAEEEAEADKAEEVAAVAALAAAEVARAEARAAQVEARAALEEAKAALRGANLALEGSETAPRLLQTRGVPLRPRRWPGQLQPGWRRMRPRSANRELPRPRPVRLSKRNTLVGNGNGEPGRQMRK